MTHHEFCKHVDEIFTSCKEILQSKGSAYASMGDRFANFNRLSMTLQLPRTTIWKVYYQKHMDAIDNYIKRYREDPEPIQSRFVDAINYLLLLYGMLMEDEHNEVAVEEEEALTIKGEYT